MPPLNPSARQALRTSVFKALHFYRDWFRCPVCDYHGPFRALQPATGRRRHAKCPSCGAIERHRLQHLVARKVLAGLPTQSMRMLHVAPEALFTGLFSRMFGTYETADLDMAGVDHKVDLQALPFADGSWDVVYASHVLEHIRDDRRAIAEIRRVLAPGGLAILPVPVVCAATVEYPQANPQETLHVRAPGPDYYERYTPHFARVELHESGDFPAQHQLYVYEDRTGYPNAASPWRTPMPGERHADIVPVCHA